MLKSLLHYRSSLWCRLACVAVIAAFAWVVAQFYLPGQGFTCFATFGSKMQDRFLPELRSVNVYTLRDSFGYDGQYYAQIAMKPRPTDPDLTRAVDSVPYRARRILMSWTAWLAAGGDPVRALHLFAFQNAVAWLFLAWLLFRWFPPTGWGNFVRWAGVLCCSGMVWSVRGALVDGPSLLMIAGGLALIEAGRPWLATVALGVSGLAKETNLIAGAALPLPEKGAPRSVWRWIGQGGLLVLPLGLWLFCIWIWLKDFGDPGARNFALPLTAYAAKWRETLHLLQTNGLDSFERFNVPVLIALLVQTLFILLRPRWRDPWWRVGAGYAVLMLFLGGAVWEGYPSAAVRVLLPLQLVFNVLVPRGRRWWLVLVLGNLTVLSSPDLIKPPGRESFRVEGPRALRIVEPSGRIVDVTFDTTWYGQERSFWEYWRWSRGSAELTIVNPHPFALAAEVRFGLRSNDARSVRVLTGGKLVWEGRTTGIRQDARVPAVLPPGESVWRFETPEPASSPRNGDPRQLTFSLRDLRIVLRGRVDAPAGAK